MQTRRDEVHAHRDEVEADRDEVEADWPTSLLHRGIVS
jgi:hypothetical protein